MKLTAFFDDYLIGSTGIHRPKPIEADKSAFDKFLKSSLNSEVFNIGGGSDNSLSLLEFLEILKQETGRKTKIVFSDWRPSDQKVYISDITKIKTKLNWQPKIKAREGIKRLIDWIKSNETYFS